ncbi:hypothetical protein HPO96_03955 [Kribbella sandramycini]|uniref:Uncharacterized protein n=1 Tax=Kribbella sandramycini TaxID=60450 RepID=A0A7Y4NYX9_9ACTN|nr:hypothetical protein [Kribbella sandramycini]MBB6568012.1 hypothetical protein [Kribbella sandramycini]NOL39394.1 hypothetical protein [Kribbella sandramycini]
MPPEPQAEPFVVRRRGLGSTRTLLYVCALLVAAEVLVTLIGVVVALTRGVPIRQPLETIWLSWGGSPLIFALGMPFLLLIGAITALEERQEADTDDVLLSIDVRGIHLGGDHARTVPWSDVRGICRVERHGPTGDSEWWEPYLVVLLHDDETLPHSSKAWGPSRPWPGAHEILGRALPYDELVAAVARHAPHIPVTDRGHVPD